MADRRNGLLPLIPAQAGIQNQESGGPGSPLSRGRADLSVAQARRQLAQEFRAAGLDTPDLDARLLIGHALGLDHAALAAQADRKLGAADLDAISALSIRRLAHEPVARIVGVKEFWSLPLRLNAETLVPRPETETVVEAALDTLDRRRFLRIADLGTGSGALLLALLSELQAARGVGTDLSFAALTCARANAEALGLDARASFLVCDQGSALRPPFDLLVANPPYVARGVIGTLAPEVRLFDPERALDGGPDGLDAYRAIARDARRLLAPDGLLVVELGFGQIDPVSRLFMTVGLVPQVPRHDLSGVPRALPVRPLP